MGLWAYTYHLYIYTHVCDAGYLFWFVFVVSFKACYVVAKTD